MSFEHLLAKSHKAGQEPWPEQLLAGHLREVMLAAEQLVDATGREQLTALGLRTDEHFERFRRLARLAAVMHDLGKANDHFQEMLRKNRECQGLRHEWVSLLMVREKLVDWLTSKLLAQDVELALWAVAGHHAKFGREIPPKMTVDGAGPTLTILWNHPDFPKCLEVIRGAFNLSAPPKFAEAQTLALATSPSAFDQIRTWREQATMAWESASAETKAMIAALKHTLVGADVAGSALPAKQQGIARRKWIAESFARKPSRENMQAVVDRRLEGYSPRKFQEQIGDSSASITLVTAGCGSGKTVGAYLWAARQHPGKRLYFCYPTTGTTTEGYRGYLDVKQAEGKAPTELETKVDALEAELFHSRADIDKWIILDVKSNDEDGDDGLARIETLDAWSKRVIACTCDTVLGVVQNNRRGIFAWPAVAGSAIVFDEIHSYDDNLFGALLRFLRDVSGVPLLLMTASLPKGRIEKLRGLAGKYKRQIHEIGGPEDIEKLPRYRMEAAPEDIHKRVRDELADSGKVLWVSNTVNRVMESADALAGAKVYHSRFKYGDRVRQHKTVVDAFNPELSMEPVVACCSQVAEMSLDLKGCTLLVTDLAPVPAMIQRLGRLNRDAKPGSKVRQFIVIEIDSTLPYKEEELDETRTWLKGLADRDLHQCDLIEEWKKTDKSPQPVPCDSAWLDGGPDTTVKELREGSFGITVLMECDIARIDAGEALGLYALPMPKPNGNDWKSWPRHKGITVAPDQLIDYDPKRGARWRK